MEVYFETPLLFEQRHEIQVLSLFEIMLHKEYLSLGNRRLGRPPSCQCGTTPSIWHTLIENLLMGLNSQPKVQIRTGDMCFMSVYVEI
jgi:hypothetical protein